MNDERVIPRSNAERAPDRIQFLGFDANGLEVELFLGRSFETFVLTKDQVRFRCGDGVERVARRGDVIERTVDGFDVERMTNHAS